MDLVRRPPAGGADRAGHQPRPCVDIAPRIADDRRTPGGAAGGVNAHDLLHRHGEHAERIVPAQVVLGGERELCQILQLPQVVRVYAGGGKVLPVMADPLVGVAQHGSHAPELQGAQFIQTGRLDRFAPIRVAHSSSSRCYSLTNALIGTPPRSGLSDNYAPTRCFQSDAKANRSGSRQLPLWAAKTALPRRPSGDLRMAALHPIEPVTAGIANGGCGATVRAQLRAA